MIRVAIVDDHAVVRQGLEQLLAVEDDIEVVGTASNGEEAHALLAAATPDVFLMDLSMPDVDGIEATRRILADSPGVHVVVLTSFADRQRILDALEAGASGYLLKDADPSEVAEAVRVAAAGESPLDPKAARVLLDARREQQPANAAAEKLTAREREVLELVGQGLANKQIARRLGIAERTVKAHLTSVFQTIGVVDRTQAALWAQKNLSAAP
jgi:DNA-binding NarL/FixJ family response regulator